MKIKIILLPAIAFLLTFTNNSHAEIRPGTFSLTPNTGFYHFDFKQLKDIDNPIPLGIGLGFDFNDQYGIEGTYNFGRSRAQVDGSDVDFYFYRIELLNYYKEWKGIVPYIAMGAGALKIDYTGERYKDSLADFGFGLKYFFTDKLGLKTDGRIILLVPEHHFLFSLCLNIRFG